MQRKEEEKILVPALMYTEESGEDGRTVLFIKSLPWQVSKVLKEMDLKEKRKGPFFRECQDFQVPFQLTLHILQKKQLLGIYCRP